MADVNITTYLFGELSLKEGMSVLEPMFVFIIGMVIYSIFIFKFYNLISRKTVFSFTGGTYGQHTGMKKVAYVVEYIFLFPVITFIWFFIISVILAMISEVLTISNVFMISMAVLATIRVTAYYDEDLSKDIAKLLPFGLLAIFLLDISTITVNTPFEILSQLSGIGKTIVYYFGFIFVVEVTLRIFGHIRGDRHVPVSPKLKAQDVAEAERNI